MSYCGARPPRELDPTGTRSCSLTPPHHGKPHRNRTRDNPIEWPNTATPPTIGTAAAKKMASNPKGCSGDHGLGHLFVGLPISIGTNWGLGTDVERVRQWEKVKSGRVCRRCWDFYDERPECDDWQCRHASAYREADWRFGREPPANAPKRWYCGIHAPSKKKERAQTRAARKAIEIAEIREKYAPEHELAEARDAIMDEAFRWRDDEQATEGFCDDPCEHHECRLARALARVERARKAVKEARASR